MRPKAKNTSLLAKYSQLYKQKPQSRVFAPLAETYRSLGMIDQALEILAKGIKKHPSYTLGYIVLAHCYVEKGQFEEAYKTLRPFIGSNYENLRLQKLFANICMKLGLLDEALNSYKIVLLLNPRDKESAKNLKILEDDLLTKVVVEEIQGELPFESSEDDWVQVSFGQGTTQEEEQDQWEMQVPQQINQKSVDISEVEVSERDLDDQYYYEEYDNPSEEVIEEEDTVDDKSKPIITHTLVDLYCGQGYYDKAIELLESILKEHPKDIATQERLAEVKFLMNGPGEAEISLKQHKRETQDNEKLLDLVEKSKDSERKKLHKLSEVYYKFLEEIKKNSSLKSV